MVNFARIAFAAAGVVAWCATAQAQTFDNAAVLKLAAAGLGDGAIVAKIKSLPCAYDLSTDQLVALKGKGLSDAVITAMVERCAGSIKAQGTATSSADPAVAHRPGIYVEIQQGAGHELTAIRPTIASGMKMSGNGSVLFPFKATLTVPQPEAHTTLKDNKPTFWFYFDPANANVGDFGSADTSAAQSPSEFSLVHFKQKEGGRQIEIGKMKGMIEHAGIDSRNTIAITTEEVSDGIFKVTLPKQLEAGQYGFVLPGERNRYRIYDFSVG